MISNGGTHINDLKLHLLRSSQRENLRSVSVFYTEKNVLIWELFLQIKYFKTVDDITLYELFHIYTTIFHIKLKKKL